MEEERVIHIQRPKIPLVLRARFAWTFFGAGLFAAINLFLIGFYLLKEAIRDPLHASGAVIVSAGFMLALAGFLFVYLLRPRVEAAFVTQSDWEPHPNQWPTRILTVQKEEARQEIEVKQALGFERQLPPVREAVTLRRALAPADSGLPARYDDGARVPQ
jgi:hypothetical protein